MRALLLAVILATPTQADPIPGFDDPAFQAPFQRALASDDPTALTDLHAAAEAGNTAALLALPPASEWLRAELPFTERRKLARVNGTPIAEAYIAADPVAALWRLGDIGSDTDALLARALGLYAANEPDKATSLYMTWLNITGGFDPLPAGFFDQPAPDWATAQILWGRLNATDMVPQVESDALVVERLKADDPAAWMALAGFASLHRSDGPPADTARLAAIFSAAGIPQDEAARRMQSVVPVLKVMRYEPVDLSIAKAAIETFRNEPEFEPLLAVCTSACPTTADDCTAAFVAGFGHPFGRATTSQPLTSLISTADFFATPRGRTLFLRSTAGAIGPDPATSKRLATTRAVNACLADAILAALP
ncbi:MAG: hypothetical protein J0L76_15210 [Rhodobacterales bacterium]|nr:hypothetical protein [Rhodobacterales bacterium]